MKIEVHANQITAWKNLFLNGAPDVLGNGTHWAKAPAETAEQLQAQIGQL